MRWCKNFLDTVSRRKSWDVRSLHHTELTRSLNVLELVGIGIGSCAGLGVFVMSAHVARYQAGPTAVLSVLVASLAALLSGICHTELATRLPRSGTGYVYCYVTLGELLAFVIGWSVLFENVLNGAIAAKAIWQYMEYMYNYTEDFNSTGSVLIPGRQVFTTSPDFFSCCIVIAIIFITFITIKRYATVNFVLMSMSGLVILAFVCVGFFHVDAKNWNSYPGFFAHGFSGIISGAALLMSTFVSVDNLASCAEESRTPCKSLPTAFQFSLSIVFTILFFVTSALTLASPWQLLTDNASLARAYESKGIFAANYIIGFGAVVGLLPVVIGSFLHPVRLMYAMSHDRLLPKIFSKVAYNGIPFCPHLVTGIFMALCTLSLEFSTMLEMTSIATILQFISSSVILIFIRYQPLPVGICREYSDLDLQMSNEDGLDSKDALEFNETRPKLVLLANGDHKIQRSEDSLYSSITDSSVSSKAGSLTDKISRSKNNLPNPDFNDASFQFSSTSSLTFVNRFKKQPPTGEVYSEKDSLRLSVADRVIVRDGGYGLTGEGDIRRNKDATYNQINESSKSGTMNLTLNGSVRSANSSISSSLAALSPCGRHHADEQTWRHTRYFLLLYILSSTCLTATCQAWRSEPASSWWAVTLFCISLVLMMVSALCIARQPQNATRLYFKAPYVPLVPLLSVSLNMLLLGSLPLVCWTRFALWLVPGLFVYVVYSHRHSIHRQHDDQEVVLFDISQLPSTNAS